MDRIAEIKAAPKEIVQTTFRNNLPTYEDTSNKVFEEIRRDIEQPRISQMSNQIDVSQAVLPSNTMQQRGTMKREADQNKMDTTVRNFLLEQFSQQVAEYKQTMAKQVPVSLANNVPYQIQNS